MNKEKEIQEEENQLNNINWYEEDMEILSIAMLKAKEAFDKYFEERDMDAAFWHLEMVGYVLDSYFEPHHKLEMKFNLDLDLYNKDKNNSEEVE